jgi:hypothetical protein
VSSVDWCLMRRLLVVVAVVLCAALAGCAATTRPASDVTASGARLNAAGLTNSTPAHYYFQYATAPQALGTGFGFQTPTRGPIPANTSGPGGSLLPFGEQVTSLTPNTTYYYRVCGGDGQTTQDVCAQTESFTTPNVYNTPGTYSWTVPAGVTRAEFDLSGAQGGGTTFVATGRAGAHVRAVLSVKPGEALTVLVGGHGGTGDHNAGTGGAGGSNGGASGGDSAPLWGEAGGGGGASDIRTGAAGSGGLSTRLLVAGGGGGTDSDSASCGQGGAGGLVGLGGQNGCLPMSSPAAGGGGGGTASAGGAGGTGEGVNGSGGANGTLGSGGAGGSDTGFQGIGAGGGGGGYYGGGGGGSGYFVPPNQGTGPGGGGGGSSFITPTALCSSPVDTGVQTGDGAVTITYNPTAC